jgi:nicotinate-nucleotide--dimethylbenzimidazole phosphoribosyltransferase
MTADFRPLAQAAIDAKTKPLGALGALEALAVDLAVWQRTLQPSVDPVRVLVFGADHGVTAEGVSAYPAEVTAQMMAGFAAGGAAINVLARTLDAQVEVIDVGVAADLEALAGIVHAKVRRGSGNLRIEPAMTPREVERALAAGAAAATRAADAGCRTICLGEMGIGNTTSAAALVSAFTGAEPAQTVGRGTGVDDAKLVHKREVVAAALARHLVPEADARALLGALGGLEIAAMAGAAIAGAERGLTVVVDGFIATAAVLAAVRMQPSIRSGLVFAHRSAETGHRVALDALDAVPLLDLGLRLGEGTGAVLALPLLRAACAVLREMATFESAGVAERIDD